VDNSGNFSVTVLTTALSRSFGIELISWTSDAGREQCSDVELETGFIVHNTLGKHWYTVRKIGNHWWNLDSLLDNPVHISPFYLDVFINQHRMDNNTIFIARCPDWPVAGHYRYDPSQSPNTVWYKEKDLLAIAKKSGGAGPNRSAGKNRVGNNGNNASLSGLGTAVGSYVSKFVNSMFDSSDTGVSGPNDYVADEDDDLARAIAASLQEK
jgi:hypothetical protein